MANAQMPKRLFRHSTFGIRHLSFASCHSPIALLRDGVLLELLVQVATRRADHFGGLRDVPGVLTQLLDEKLPLRGLLELAERARGDVGVAGLCRPRGRGAPA